MMKEFTTIGRSVRLQDGRSKVTGTTRYATDIQLPGMLHARLVTSPHAHADILAIDIVEAMSLPEVAAVLTAKDLPAFPAENRRRLLLARHRVIFAGQPVALVLAESEAAAQDGAERINVDYQPKAAAVTIEQALADDAPLIWPTGVPGESDEAGAHGADVGDDSDEPTQTNISGHRHFQRGDIDKGFDEAEAIVELDFTTSMVHQGYIEPHSTVAQPDPLTGGMTIWTSTQAPFWAREEVASVLDVPESEVRVVGTPVGGAFGGKFVLYEPLVALAAQHSDRPVRLVLTRLEEMLAANPAPSARFKVQLGAKNDGTFTALAADIVFESGCFPGFHGISALLMGSCYQVPNLDINYQEVLTFKPSVGAYRAPSVPQATFALESVVDELARHLAVDPIELRLRNASAPGDPMASGTPWNSMGMREVLEALQDHPAWQNRDKTRATGRGVGLAIGGWPGGTEPAAATCMLNRDGQLHVHIGAIDLTGTQTGFALLAAEAFGVDPDRIRVIQGDTASAPYAGAAGGSKITYTVGPAVVQAAEEARAQVLEIASEEFEVDPADLDIADGAVHVRGLPGRRISLGKLAGKTMQFGGKYAPILGHGRHADNRNSPAFCAQLAEVEVDEETGSVRVPRLVVVQDVGLAINPSGIKGQMIGGATQGLGWALYEDLHYDENGQLLTGTLMEYALPRADQVAGEIETVMVEVASDHGPHGARGVGEPPVIPTAGAVANAITDATGKRLTDLPMASPRLLE
jgi:CO/xanthine dehydrogenase Mo-binding subunit